VRQWRERTVYYIEVLEVRGRDVRFRVGCEAGTYIRKLVHDFGLALGCGAHMTALVRTQAGPFKTADSVTLDELHEAVRLWKFENDERELRRCIQPIERAVIPIAKVWVDDGAVPRICFGSALFIPGLVACDSGIQPGDMLAVMTLKDELATLAIAHMSTEEMLEAKKGIAAKPTKALLDPALYLPPVPPAAPVPPVLN
jgi:H/ACA ribonucleoprotein complex subunit 4